MFSSIFHVGSCRPCGGCPFLLRPFLEGTLGIGYIAKERHEDRALAYIVAYQKRRIKKLRVGDRGHPSHKQLAAEMAKDEFVKDFMGKLPVGVVDEADRLERRLNDTPDFQPALAEWNKLKEKKPGVKKTPPDPNWYTLFGGPASAARLAAELKCYSFYEFLYRDWSDSIHAGDALDTFWAGGNYLRPLRYPAHYGSTLKATTGLFLMSFHWLAMYYKPSMAEQFRVLIGSELVPDAHRLGELWKKNEDKLKA